MELLLEEEEEEEEEEDCSHPRSPLEPPLLLLQ